MGSEPNEDKLESLVAGLERLSVDAEVKAPEHEQELQRLLEEARSVVAEARLERVERPARPRQRVTVSPEILAEGQWLKAELSGPPTDDDTPRFFKVVVLGVGLEVSTDQVPWVGKDEDIVAEGRWLKGMLSGPPTDDDGPRFLREVAQRVGLEVSTDRVAETRADDAVLD